MNPAFALAELLAEADRAYDATPDWDQHRLHYLRGRSDALNAVRLAFETFLKHSLHEELT